MARKNPFPSEPKTQPERRTKRPPARGPRVSAPAPKSRRERAEAPTLPPGARSTPPDAPERVSDIRNVAPELQAATVDEVVADLSKDPRCEPKDGK